MSDYAFTTLWLVGAPADAVWEAICHPEHWPVWWRGVEQVVEVQRGDDRGVGSVHRYAWKSRLPYRLTFDMRTVRVEPPVILEGAASGDLEGTGRWYLWSDAHWTVVRYDWQVRTTKRWMNLVSTLARPLFRWNHDVAMRWGAQGLAKRLGTRVIEGRELGRA
ncbi:SRPBCC family protein [Thermomicrobiaceae bacterium CFH 74404]|uniref:SRPBCC family protein n=2 Tax=Thermomicrobia TaxID=189775 RepID=A0AA42B9Y5_9BACT|nr:SRPBCC family protein [Thermalbibacter longus]MCM8749012.1 SRPBCC family protein [Thermalbibacter longus]